MTKIKKSFLLKPLAFFLIPVTLVFYTYLGFLIYFDQKIYPGVKIASFSVGRQLPTTSKALLELQFQERLKEPLEFSYQEQQFTVDLKNSSPALNLDSAVKSAYQIGRSASLFQDLNDQLQALLFGKNLPLNLNYQKKTALTTQISSINQLVSQKAVNAQVVLGNTITITPSEEGLELDEELFLTQIDQYLSLSAPLPKNLPLKTTLPKFNTEKAQTAKGVLDKLQNSPLKLKAEEKEWIVDQKIALSFLYLGNGNFQPSIVLPVSVGSDRISRNITPEENLVIDQKKLEGYIASLAAAINQPVADARFTFDPNLKRVKEFQSAQVGQKLDEEKAALLINQALVKSNTTEIELPIETVEPKTTNSETNDYGIKELLGQGVSNFSGSIDNRIYNIKLAASRINGVLIPPGGVFSFNSVVGDISAASGYKQAYVIKEGRTVLDDGGGVCQVSTTVFRAALNTGLPIVSRTAHAYRVSYYEQGFPPGLDATVFSPSVDFKFKNDTAAHILIQTRVTGTALYVDIYGTPDGRVATLSKPVINSQTPPPPELRQDDPTLPKGVIKQVDWPAWGANVSFSRTVTRGGETLINETFRSNYRAWQAVYLVGTKE